MAVEIPVKTKYDKSGVDAAERDLKRLQREAVASTRAQIAEHRKVAQLTAKLDRDLARDRKASFKDQLKDAVGGQMLAVNALQNLLGGLKDFGVESVKAAAAADRLAKAADSMALGFGSSGKEITRSIQEASNYTIGQMDAMQAANQAMLLGVAKSPEEFERLSKVAVALGRAMGQDATKSIEDLTIGMGRQSKLILDNLGLMVSAEEANRKYAAAVGKSVSDLTDAEKKQAFINEALEQGEKKMATLGGQTLDTAGKVERLSARWGDFQIEFGRAVGSMGESTGVLDLLNAGLDRLIAGAEGWQGAAKGADLLSASLDKMNKGTWLEDLEQIPVIGGQIKGLDFWGSMLFRNDELQEAVTSTGAEMEDLRRKQEEAAKAARAQADAEAAAADGMADAADKAEELARKLEAANKARRDVAGELIDITNEAAEETKATWDEYFEKEQDAWQDHQNNVAKIQAGAAKEQAKIQKDLVKNLAKEDKDAARDVERIRRDSAKAIRRAQEDNARQEKQQRRQRQIETKADQRLFDYDMRQLAAEGEFNQIQQAMERRAIEKQIEAAKASEEDRSRQENSRVEIERMRQDAADQIAERQAQAEERKQELQEQAAEALAANQERLAEELAQEQAAYEQKMADLRQWRDDKLAEIEASKQESIAKLAEELAENEDLTKEEMEALIPVAGKLGEDVGKSFAEGLSAGFARNNQIDEMLAGLGGDTETPARSTPSSRPGAMNQQRQTTKTKSIYGFAGGTDDFTVPPGFPDDSFMIGLTSGERFKVQTPQQQAGGGLQMHFTIQAGEELSRKLIPAIQAAAERVVNDHFESVIVPWSNG